MRSLSVRGMKARTEGECEGQRRAWLAGMGSARTSPAQGLWPFASSSLPGHASVYSPADQPLKRSPFWGAYFAWGIFEGCRMPASAL